MPPKIVCFTGHRPSKLGGYDESIPVIVDIKEQLKQAIEKAIGEGYTGFIAGGALGVDTWAAEIVLALRDAGAPIYLLIAVPCLNQDKVWPQSSKDRYQRILKAANRIVYVSEKEYDSSCMQARNIWMVAHSTLVIAVFDGTPGGTKNCVDYATAKGKEIITICPKK